MLKVLTSLAPIPAPLELQRHDTAKERAGNPKYSKVSAWCAETVCMQPGFSRPHRLHSQEALPAEGKAAQRTLMEQN